MAMVKLNAKDAKSWSHFAYYYLDYSYTLNFYFFVCLFVCFVALRPKSAAMVIAGWSVHLTIFFPMQA